MHTVALSIAGSDPSGGAGIQADLKTFHQLGVYGMSVLTLLTVQNTQGVRSVRFLEPEFVLDQLDAVLADIPPAAAKTGALGTEAVIRALGEKAAAFPFPLVVDPVMISKHGAPLLTPEGCSALADCLLPRALLVTPNLHEAGILAGMQVADRETMKEAARRIHGLGPRGVLIKGGHLAGEALDILYWKGEFIEFSAPRIAGGPAHGTGCTFSAAITAGLARGLSLPASVEKAKKFITDAISSMPGLGKGIGPVNHHAQA